jgi:hypothetical protein
MGIFFGFGVYDDAYDTWYSYLMDHYFALQLISVNTLVTPKLDTLSDVLFDDFDSYQTTTSI